MRCTLMHKNIPVVDMEIDPEDANIIKMYSLKNPEHLPVGTKVKDDVNRAKMNDWLRGRSIPASRDGIGRVLENINLNDTSSLIVKCYGLSLSDHYWISPEEHGLEWEKINFFQNDFSKDMGELLFGSKNIKNAEINFISPDNTSDGWLRKKWIIADEKRILMKGGSGVYEQEPFNEVVASAAMRRMNVPHVEYTLLYDKEKPYSLCENFITPDSELIPAYRIITEYKKENNVGDYGHLINCCKKNKIENCVESLNKMIVVDYIILNEDRHYNNFGFVRNPVTLEWKGLAPIYDSGTSLWYNTQFVGENMESKPFKKNHDEQIKLVKDMSWFEPELFRGFEDEIMDIFSLSKTVDQKRSASIAKSVMNRIKHLYLLKGKNKTGTK